MSAYFLTHAPPHLLGEYATGPSELCLHALDGVANPRDTHGFAGVCTLPGPENTAHSGTFNCRI